MRMSYRYFLFGTLAATLTWMGIIFFYFRVLDKSRSTDAMLHSESQRLRFKPRQLAEPEVDNQAEKFGYNHLDKLVEDLDDKLPEEKHVVLHDLGVIVNAEDQEIKDRGYSSFAFNALLSDRIGPHRHIPDTRTQLCRHKKFPRDLPTVSVVICYYNELLSVLVRTVVSILARTPKHLLKEVILIDDHSTATFNGKLHSALKQYQNVRHIRLSSRQGLIRARTVGARSATSDVIMFMDSHCEVNKQWLEPMLMRIKENPETLAIPVIDIINMDTFRYEQSPLVRGGFNWGLHFKWDTVPGSLLKTKEDYVKPIPTPTMAGGLFAVNRNYFMELGAYDEGMDIWGGENIEISFRAWMCGGRLEIIPCSRVGHVFRRSRPYGDPSGKDSMTRNSVRLAKVWMDDYIKYYFQLRPGAARVEYGDIQDRVELRKQLKCQSFKWYLETVYPEQRLPNVEQSKSAVLPRHLAKNWNYKVKRDGMLQLKGTNLCVATTGDIYTKKALLKLTKCDMYSRKMFWQETEDHAFILARLLCLDIPHGNNGRNFPRTMKCSGERKGQNVEWKGEQLLNHRTGLCISVPAPETEARLQLDDCEEVKVAFTLVKSAV